MESLIKRYQETVGPKDKKFQDKITENSESLDKKLMESLDKKYQDIFTEKSESLDKKYQDLLTAYLRNSTTVDGISYVSNNTKSKWNNEKYALRREIEEEQMKERKERERKESEERERESAKERERERERIRENVREESERQGKQHREQRERREKREREREDGLKSSYKIILLTNETITEHENINFFLDNGYIPIGGLTEGPPGKYRQVMYRKAFKTPTTNSDTALIDLTDPPTTPIQETLEGVFNTSGGGKRKNKKSKKYISKRKNKTKKRHFNC